MASVRKRKAKDGGIREYAHDRDSKLGRLDKALDEAKVKSWIVVDMKADWNTIFPPEALRP